MNKTIGWIGTGVMGASMAGHILDAGFKLNVYNRTKFKADDLVQRGAKWCETPKEIAEKSDIIFTMVGFPKDVEETYFDEKGIFNEIDRNKIVIDMTTSEPTLARKIGEEAVKRNCMALDAPVSGGDIGARNASLVIMVGGNEETYNEILPLFELMGKNIKLMGEHGCGQHTKMANQISVAAGILGTVETLRYASKAGLELEKAVELISGGAGGSWQLANMGKKLLIRILSQDFLLNIS